MLVKTAIRELLKAVLPSRQTPILVASMGRAGSTLIYESLIEAMIAERFGGRSPRLHGLVREAAWRLGGARFHDGRVYKTHDFPCDLKPGERPLVVFLFGSASDAARSVMRCATTYGHGWIETHFEHLQANGTIEDIPNSDILRFGEQLDLWLACESVPVLALRYEDLWSSGAEEILSRYTGLPIRLPPRRVRESIGMDLGDTGVRLKATYEELDAYIASLEPVLVNTRAKAWLEMCQSNR